MWSNLYPQCINLKTRDDRYNHAKKVFDGLGIDVEFFRTDKHPNGGCEGCFNSHIECIKRAYDKGLERALIFEDDISLEVSQEKLNTLMEKVERFITKNNDWDLFYLGGTYSFYHYYRRINENIISGPCICTHAYIINRRMMKRMLEYEYDGRPIDVIYSSLKDTKSYSIRPFIFDQYGFSSDIETSDVPVEKFKQFKRNYTYYIGTLWYVSVLILIVLVILMIAFWWWSERANVKFDYNVQNPKIKNYKSNRNGYEISNP